MDTIIWDNDYFISYIEYTLNKTMMDFDNAVFIKGIARCPICNSEYKSDFEIGKTIIAECKNCLSEFSIERVGSIYYTIGFNN